MHASTRDLPWLSARGGHAADPLGPRRRMTADRLRRSSSTRASSGDRVLATMVIEAPPPARGSAASAEAVSGTGSARSRLPACK